MIEEIIRRSEFWMSGRRSGHNPFFQVPAGLPVIRPEQRPHLGHISEFAAIQRAQGEVRKRAEGEFDAVASLGGESFLVYTLAGGRVTNVLSRRPAACKASFTHV
jgi:hypothetical protein